VVWYHLIPSKYGGVGETQNTYKLYHHYLYHIGYRLVKENHEDSPLTTCLDFRR